jgi:hypothetical protein
VVVLYACMWGGGGGLLPRSLSPPLYQAAIGGVRVVGRDDTGQWGVSDSTGASVVVEFVKGVLNLHNNTVGVQNTGVGLMANDPTWDWYGALPFPL